jgi:hypothetical protein
MLVRLPYSGGLSTFTKTFLKMDPLSSLAKGVAGATLDKVQEILERDQTSEDCSTDKKLRDSLVARLPNDGVQSNSGDLRSSRGTSQIS